MANDDVPGILEVVIRYAEACDSRRWETFDDVFTPDATVDYGRGRVLEGRQAFVESVRGFLGGCGPTQHLLGNHVVVLNGDRAQASCQVRAFHAGAGDLAGATYELFAAYHDRLVRTPSGWRITHRRVEVSFELGDRGVLRPAR